MLVELTVKNFALIKEANVEFENNLNVFTGETGSGKSILLDSLNICLGKKITKEMDKSEDIIVSIVFSEKRKEIIKKIEDLDIPMYDDKIIIYRRITKDRNICKINDINCTLSKLKEITESLIDIYGQNESVNLKNNLKHLEYLDEFVRESINPLKSELLVYYKDLQDKQKELLKYNIDEKNRIREIEFLKFEIDEIENANIKENEEDELLEIYHKFSNANNIINNLNSAKENLSSMNIVESIKNIKLIKKYSDNFSKIESSLIDIESLIFDVEKDIDDNINFYDNENIDIENIENRLNLIRNIFSKYGNNLFEVKNSLKEKKEELERLINYEKNKNKLLEEISNIENKLKDISLKMSAIRKNASIQFKDSLLLELKDLGFNQVEFEICINRKDTINKNGFDDVDFLISLNVGEELKPLENVASGGELSRIMLAITTILSKVDDTETLIFDEIDAGISGITATKVSKKLNKISKNRQVICITHLPQIASMADTHFKIEKEVKDNKTFTKVLKLDEDGMINEIGRLISNDDKLSETVIENARELKKLSNEYKGKKDVYIK